MIEILSKIWPLFLILIVIVNVILQKRRAHIEEKTIPESVLNEDGPTEENCNASVDGQEYAGVIDFKLGKENLHIMCTFPKWRIAIPYSLISVQVRQGITGKKVYLNVMGSDRIRVSMSLYTKLQELSSGGLPKA
ncbi:hypothetical protein [Teredinibacter franksiae]|uniref:hypothetical protein n=1 Tax=Teredinibacter franksiae TaxID=2761453 RepID=UPI0016252360|nr:hypothetical protein [Teredinibacter franksiae]